MRPTGKLHLGNLAGALENWKRLQDTYDCYFFVADWHALSTEYADPSGVREAMREMAADWLAAGIDPARCTIFVQSRIPEHAELYLLLGMITPLGWLERVPTYKEQQQELEGRDLATYGFLGYPLLQAADILIYKADAVPVGIDQLPHLEITREIARRFNALYGPVFPEPQALLTEVPKIPGTDGRKMSKSYGNAIYLADAEGEVREKLRTMVTDPARVRRHDPGNPDVCPVFTLHRVYTPPEEREGIARDCRTAAIGCIDCKRQLADRLLEAVGPAMERRRQILARPDAIEALLEEGTRRARAEAARTMEEVRAAMKL